MEYERSPKLVREEEWLGRHTNLALFTVRDPVVGLCVCVRVYRFVPFVRQRMRITSRFVLPIIGCNRGDYSFCLRGNICAIFIKCCPNNASSRVHVCAFIDIILFLIPTQDRITSAFKFHYLRLQFNVANKRHKPFQRDSLPPDHIGARFYMDCFTSPEDMAQRIDPRRVLTGHNQEDEEEEQKCVSLARSLFASDQRHSLEHKTYYPLHHFWNDYRQYTALHWPNRSKHVAVVRTEFLWQDVQWLEQTLGGNATRFAIDRKVSHNSEAFPGNPDLTTEGARIMCCVLADELQVYQDLIVAAVNLDFTDVRQSLGALWNKCGVTNPGLLAEGAASTTLPSLEDLVAWNWSEWEKESCR